VSTAKVGRPCPLPDDPDDLKDGEDEKPLKSWLDRPNALAAARKSAGVNLVERLELLSIFGALPELEKDAAEDAKDEEDEGDEEARTTSATAVCDACTVRRTLAADCDNRAMLAAGEKL
jgi:hypothetical protein